jgi:ADP-ribosylglycohydrolase
MNSNKILLGAIAGDVIGSVYEFYSTKNLNFRIFCDSSKFTDDTIMTVANECGLVVDEG